MSVRSERSEREICYFCMRCFHEIIASKLFPYGCLNHVNTFLDNCNETTLYKS